MPPMAETTKERILRIGTELFAQQGYDATGISELSKAVGLGRGALYHHIESKEALLFEIGKALLARMIDAGDAIADQDVDGETKLRLLARTLLREHATHRDAWALVVTETRALNAEHRALINEARDRYEAIWAAALEQAANEGRLRPVDEIERRGILGMLNSARRWMRPSGPVAPEAIADRYIDMLVDGLAHGS
jgi:AcrR family transcriptional regulator